MGNVIAINVMVKPDKTPIIKGITNITIAIGIPELLKKNEISLRTPVPSIVLWKKNTENINTNIIIERESFKILNINSV